MAVFLQNSSATELCRPFVDFEANEKHAKVLQFFTDACMNLNSGGMGRIFKERWFAQKWDPCFIEEERPSIAFLELTALVTGVLLWGDHEMLRNSRIIIFCDNQSVRDMVNSLSSGCSQCMKLIRILTLAQIKNNSRIFVC